VGWPGSRHLRVPWFKPDERVRFVKCNLFTSKMSDSPLVFAMANMVGHHVQVQTMNGQVYEGIFHATDLSRAEDGPGVALRKAYKKTNVKAASPFNDKKEAPSRDRICHELLISGSNVAQISVVGMNLAFTAPPPPGADGFTDTGISGGHGQAQERELQAWKPDNNDAFGDMSMDTGATGWTPEEMFAKNARDHNYKSEYDELEYTTSINKKDPKYLQRLKDAERVAREIQKGVGVGNSTNPHLLADRGIESNMTEEELHASVIRPKGPNRYVPPSQRSKGGPPSKPPQSYSAASKPNDSKAQGGGNGPSPPKSTSPTGRNNKAPPSVWNQQRELKADPTTKARTSKSPDVVTQDLKQFSKDLKLNLKTDGKDAKAKDKKLNPAASEFKMSVKAPAFVMPGSAPAAVEAQPVTPTFQQPQGVYPGMMQMQMAQGQQQMRVAYPPNAMAYQQQQQAQMAAYQQQMAQMAQQGYSQQMYQQQQQMLAQQQQQQQQAAAGYPKGVLAQPQMQVMQSMSPQMGQMTAQMAGFRSVQGVMPPAQMQAQALAQQQGLQSAQAAAPQPDGGNPLQQGQASNQPTE